LTGKPRLVAVAVVSLVLTGLFGCGDSSGSADEDQIRQVAADFSKAIADGDYQGACDLFAPESIKFFNTQKAVPDGCAGVMRLSYGQKSDEDIKALGEVESLDVNGDKATADLGGGESAQYEKIDGNWVMTLD